jgi:hypothetical protein
MSEENGSPVFPEVPEKIQQAREAIRRDYPRLLWDYRDQWVIYHGSKLVAVARNQEELRQRFIELGPTAREVFAADITDHTLDDMFGEIDFIA